MDEDAAFIEALKTMPLPPATAPERDDDDAAFLEALRTMPLPPATAPAPAAAAPARTWQCERCFKQFPESAPKECVYMDSFNGCGQEFACRSCARSEQRHAEPHPDFSIYQAGPKRRRVEQHRPSPAPRTVQPTPSPRVVHSTPSSQCTPPVSLSSQSTPTTAGVDDDGLSAKPSYSAVERAWVVMCFCGERMWYVEAANGNPYYRCQACKLTHGAHKCDGHFSNHHRTHERGEPLGIPCDAETKQLRARAHAELDKLWQTAEERGRLYKRMAQKLGLSADESHIAYFGKSRCKELLELLRKQEIW